MKEQIKEKICKAIDDGFIVLILNNKQLYEIATLKEQVTELKERIKKLERKLNRVKSAIED
jgi:polyhydroxyalkanoate synthesis regulator phasin